MSDDKIILPDSPEAAQLRTITGWVSRDGRFFGDDERIARYAGSTHSVCECGNVTEKMYTACADCRKKHKEERIAKFPRQEWDGATPLYSEALDRYMFSVDDIEDLMVDHELEFDALQPLVCSPNRARMIEMDDFCDELPDHGEPPDALVEAADAFNKAVEGLVLSWSPTDLVATWKDAPKLKDLLDDGK